MKLLLVWLCCLLAGCLSPEEAPENDDMIKGRAIAGARTQQRGAAVPESWGQEKVFAVGTMPQYPRGAVVLTLPPQQDWRVPRVQSLITSVDNSDADSNQEYFLRWILRSGAGGARTEVVFDAVGFTRLSFPAEQVSLSLAYEPYSTANDSPSGVVKAHAYLSDFAIGELDPGPTYTALVQVAIAPMGSQSRQTINLPVGANRFRLVGNERSTVGPFRATTYVSLKQGATTVGGWFGGRLAATDANSLLALAYTGQFIPIPAGVTKVEIENTDTVNGIFGFMQFGLDL